MKKFIKVFSTLYIRLIIAFAANLIITICVIYVAFFNLSTSHYKKEITSLNNELLGQLRQLCDNSIIEKVEKSTINSFLWGDNIRNDLFMDLLFLFDNPIEGNHYKILSVQSFLQQITFSQDDVIDSIEVYYKKNNMLISSVGMKYLNPDDESFEKMLNRSSSPVDSYGFKWINKNAIDFHQVNQNNSNDVLSLFCPYPFSGIDSVVKGFIIINLKEEALLKIIHGLSPNNFGHLVIADDSGSIVLQNTDDAIGASESKNPYLEKIIKEPYKNGSFTLKAGKSDIVVSYVPSNINNWIYVRVMPLEEYFSFSYVLNRLLIIICIVTLLAGFITSNLFSLGIYKGIRKIIDVSQDFFNPGSKKDKDFYNKVIQVNDSLRLPYNLNVFKTSFCNSLPLIRYNLLVDLLNNKSFPGNQDDPFLSYIKIKDDFPYEMFSVIVIKYINMENVASLEKLIVDKEFVKFNISERITHDLLIPVKFEILDFSTEQSVIILNFADTDFSRIKNSLKDIFKSIKCTFNLTFTTAIGLSYNTIMELHSSFAEALECIKYGFIHTETYFFDYDIVKSWEKANTGFSSGIYDDLDKQLRLNSINHVIDLLASSKKYLKETLLSYNYCQQILATITNIFTRYIQDMDYNQETNLQSSMNEGFGKSLDIDEFFCWIGDHAHRIDDYMLRKKGNRNQELIERIKEYIINNIEKEISLNSIADAFYINSSNLSKIFKENTGMNLVDFIVNLRIEKSRDMILSTNRSIDKIAAINGYNNTSYFIKKFKEKYGYTPKQYRLDHAAGGKKT